ncbi:1462_t:CDS:2, partial [Acaulospora colombiana]
VKVYDNIQEAKACDRVLTFDWHSLEKAQEIIEESDNELLGDDNELLNNDDELPGNDDEMEIFRKKFERPIPITSNTKFIQCVIINNDNNQHTIQRCNNAGVRCVKQLSSIWKIDSWAVREVEDDVSKLELVNSSEEPIENQNLFGLSSIMKEWQTKMDTVFDQLISLESTFDIEHIDAAIKKNINSAFFVASPNVVILEPGEAPNKNKHVHQAVNMFLEDFGYTENSILNLVCNEVIYHHMKDYKSDEQTICCILGQWHANKAMYSALIAAFLGYRLFGLATQLGVMFFDKLEQVADYRATF